MSKWPLCANPKKGAARAALRGPRGACVSTTETPGRDDLSRKRETLLVGSLKLCRALTPMDGRPSSGVEKPMRGGLHAETREPRPTEEETSEGKKAKRGPDGSLRLTANCRSRIRRMRKPLEPNEREAGAHAP